MKQTLTSIASLFLVGLTISFLVISCGSNKKPAADGELEGTISISGAFALYPLTVRWAEEFRKEHPHVRIDISAGGAGKGMTDVLSGMVDLAMFSREITEVEIGNGAFGIAVAKDAVLPTICSNNPYIDMVMERGFTQEAFTNIFVTEKDKFWGEVLGNKSLEKVNAYTRSDACGAAEIWAKYLGVRQEDLNGVGVFGDPGIADAVKADPYGIGYNNLIFAYDMRTGKTYDGIRIIPLDLNANGKVDPEEQFYDNMESVMQAIKDGVYPSPPARPLYLISKGKPTNPVVIAFLKYILTKGNEIVHEAGYIQLPAEFEQAELERLN